VIWGKFFTQLNLAVGFTKEARDAQRNSEWNGLPPELNYRGGNHLMAEHLIPEFHSGVPGVVLGSFKVARVCDGGGLDIREAQSYDPVADAWTDRFGNIINKRDPADLWMPKSDYVAASERAVQRMLRSQLTSN
jgi:hypothetical protein